MSNLQLSILIPTKNEELNIGACLDQLKDWVNEIVVIDSQSTDNTINIAKSYGAEVIQFYYKGGWPKKRQWALDNYKFRNKWILLLDADEILTKESKKEIENAIVQNIYDGYYLWFRLEFLGRVLKRSDPGLRKLSLFKLGIGKFEKRLEDQNITMACIEQHEHVIVNGNVGTIKSFINHRNVNNLSRFIIKHDEGSNYESRVHIEGGTTDLVERFWGSKEERRRYIKKRLIRNPFAPFAFFLYLYVFKLGFLEGYPGFYYIIYQCIYLYFVSSKIYEIENEINKKEELSN